MLDRLAAKAQAAGFTNVEMVQAGLVSFKHSGAPVDFVYSRWALHHLPAFWKGMALDRMRQILRPGGVLRLLDIAYSFEPSEITDRIHQWRSMLPIEAKVAGEWVQGDIDEHVRDEHSTFSWLLEPMIERSGFRIDETVHSPDGLYAEYVVRAVRANSAASPITPSGGVTQVARRPAYSQDASTGCAVQRWASSTGHGDDRRSDAMFGADRVR